MKKSSYIQRQQIIRRRIEKTYVPLVRKALRQQWDNAIAVVQAKGVMAAQGHPGGDIVNSHIAGIIQALYKDAARMAFGKFKVTKEKKDLPDLSDLPDYIKRIFPWLDKYLLGNVVLPISQTTIDDIDRVIRECLRLGLGSEETVARLKSSEIPDWRSKMIVRTETAKATNIAQTIAADSQDYEMEKQWIAVEDDRTRLSHSNHGGVDGERVPLYERYSNGLMFPGDPLGAAKEVINCRCTQGFFAARDLDGNLIPKQKKDIDLLSLLNHDSWKPKPSA